MSSKKYPLTFFQQETSKVACELLGAVLVKRSKTGTLFKGIIVETEAYLGLQDDCCHSFGGRKTNRTKTMYLPGGHAYIYFTYGMHYCFNIVTNKAQKPEAVLIRAIQPLTAISEMMKNRNIYHNLHHLTNGPAKICKALGIDKTLNSISLNGDILYIEKGSKVSLKNIVVSRRIGLSPLKQSCYWPLRFYIQNNPYVSF